jgi:hypothetical protein
MKPHPGMDTGVPVTVCRKNLTLVTQGSRVSQLSHIGHVKNLFCPIWDKKAE